MATKQPPASSTTNEGYDTPASDPTGDALEQARAQLARGRNAIDNPVQRQYAGELHSDDMADEGEQCLDMMAGNFNGFDLAAVTEVPPGFREFKTLMEYEAFMAQPVVIRVHETRSESDPPAVFVGCNGDTRWLPRNVNVRVPRRLVESLARSRETLYKTEDNRDPNSDSMKTTHTRKVHSSSFSVLRDPSPMGGRWLQRVMRAGS